MSTRGKITVYFIDLFWKSTTNSIVEGVYSSGYDCLSPQIATYYQLFIDALEKEVKVIHTQGCGNVVVRE